MGKGRVSHRDENRFIKEKRAKEKKRIPPLVRMPPLTSPSTPVSNYTRTVFLATPLEVRDVGPIARFDASQARPTRVAAPIDDGSSTCARDESPRAPQLGEVGKTNPFPDFVFVTPDE